MSTPVTGKDTKPEDEAKAFAKLCITVHPALYVHIKKTKTSKELWDKPKSLFDDSGFSRKISLLHHLISVQRENCEDMITYVTQIVETSQRLNGTGFEITDQRTLSSMLAGLPEKLSPLVMAIEHSVIGITADVIKTKWLDSEPLQLMVATSKETLNTEAAFALNGVDCLERSELDTEKNSDCESSQVTFCETDAGETHVPESSSSNSSLRIQSPEQILDRPKRVRCKPGRYHQLDLLATADTELTVTETSRSPVRVKWKKAMDEEMKSFQENKIFELVDVPKAVTISQR
ncbi:hypothetical protein EVAR_34654_1 [Eumeta japonica]|uniref:Retrovirus-related Pol polyprotein from transposon TNT 1-94 n=1 Tax=Eumeta variegata TaxID=151549 RepID=A0A4C1VH53_EUMVA|nr:hypothetical protein EVAR_34654_1 [Eumeta japonica]